MPTAAYATSPRFGGAGGVRVNRVGRRSEQTVWVPERLFVGAHYSDEAVMVWVKVAALDARRHLGEDPCSAAVAELAHYIGMSVSTVERGLRPLRTPGPDNGPAELTTVRRTHKGGTGRTAQRLTRAVLRSEPAVQVRVTAAETLTPRRFRAYLHLLRAERLHLQPSAAELAGELHHQRGEKAGQVLGERTARRLLHDLAATGWIDLDERAGGRGRHAITVQHHPVRAVPAEPAGPGTSSARAAAAPSSPDNHDGSGADDHDGSLASKEDLPVLTDGCARVGSSIRRRRGDRSSASAVDNLGDLVPDTFGRGPRALRADDQTAPSTPPPATTTRYTGPTLQLSPRVWAVLAPVRHLLPGIRPYMVRQIARAIGAQLDAGCAPARLTQRLQLRYAANLQELADPGRWILGAGLPRRGRHRACDLAECEGGRIWHSSHGCTACASGDTDHTDRPCLVCHELYRADQTAREQHTPPTTDGPVPGRSPGPVAGERPRPGPSGGWHECRTCRAPSRTPLTDSLCGPCRAAA